MTDITFDISKLTIDEIEIVEDLVDRPITELDKPGLRTGKLLRAIAYIEGRRSDPSFTLEDAGKVVVDPKAVAGPLAAAASKDASSESPGS